MARPTVITSDVVLKLEQAFAIDATVEEACTYADIARNTFYVYLEKNPEFKDRMDELRQKPTLKARDAVVKSLDDPDRAFRYLERKRKNEFAARVEQTGAEGKDLIPEDNAIVDELNRKLNELYKGTTGSGMGEVPGVVDTEAQG